MTKTLLEAKLELRDLMQPFIDEGSLQSFKIAISALGELWMLFLGGLTAGHAESKEEFIKLFNEALDEMNLDHRRYVMEIANENYKDEK